MDINRVLNTATKAGTIMLENGGETYRVEETMIRIALALGVKSIDVYATPTVIILSAKDKNYRNHSTLQRTYGISFNLDKISKINHLSRSIEMKHLNIDDLEMELAIIEHKQGYPDWLTTLSSAMAAGFFTLLFNGNIKDFFCAVFIGGIIKCTTIFLSKFNVYGFFINLVGGMEAAGIALFLYKLNLCSHYDKAIIGSIMLLVPGLSITNAIRDTINGDLVSSVTRTMDAIFTAVAIAVGTGMIFKIWFGIFGGVNL
jgi:uncharacterized membrane protein YjjP (DUF1212 family)